MPTYTYRCARCGPFDLTRTIAQRAQAAHCPRCDDTARRVFANPHLSTLNPALDQAVTNASLSAESPQVTRSVTQPRRNAPAVAQVPGYPPLPQW